MILNSIITGDSAEVLKAFDADCIDLTVTSPPYDNLRTYNGFIFDFKTIARELYRVTKPGGVVVWVVGDATINGSETLTSFKQALFFRECGFNVETMIYEVAGTGAKGSHDYYWQAFEYMFVFAKGKIKTSNRLADKKNLRAGAVSGQSLRNTKEKERGQEIYTTGDFGIRTNIWRYQVGNNGDDQSGHPAPFPEALARDHILSWSNPGDIVLDPFCGSGTTPKAAKQLKRDYIGIEISAEYVTIAEKRLLATTPALFA
jgi:site-specific DNA-methyltransferase (adenine-specific)